MHHFIGLAWRNLQAHRLRTLLNAIIISLGVAMTIAAEYVSRALLAAFSEAGGGDMQITHGFMVEQFDLMLSSIGYVLMAAAAFLIFNTFAMTITQRQQQIGLLRSLGMMRQQVLRLVLLEALLIGGIGVLAGILIGPMLGNGIVTMLRLLAGDILGFGAGSFSTSTLLLAAVLGMIVTLIAVLAPARRATTVSPLAALREGREEGVETRELRFGVPKNRQSPISILLIIALFTYLLISPPGNWAYPPWNVRLTGLFIGVWLVCLGLLLPALIRLTGAMARRWWGSWSVNGRLAADNLNRAPGRAMLTTLTLAIGLTTIVALTGFMTFAFDELFGFTFDEMARREMWALFPFDLEQGTAALSGVDALQLPAEQINAFRAEIGDRADITPIRFASVPELSFMGHNYFTFIAEPAALQDGFFTMSEGDWETAVALMKSGCGALVAPAVAQRIGVSVGDAFTITGINGPVSCTLAGIGAGFVNASILGNVSADLVGATEIVALVILPDPNTDLDQLVADMRRIANRSAKTYLTSMNSYADLIGEAITLFSVAMNGVLLLAVIAATLGVVNTMMMSVNERRRELGLLRTIGGTRRQVAAVVTGEALLLGVAGGVFGLLAGAGILIILVVTYGGHSWGIPDLALWPAVVHTLRPALFNGLVGLVAIPLISAAAARFPARAALHGTALHTLQPDYAPLVKAQAASWLTRGSIRARFVVGTVVLMLIVLAGLVTVVTLHAGSRLTKQMQTALHTLVSWNASMVELALPADASTIDLDALQANSSFGFDADMLLRFESLMDEISEQGLRRFALTNQDGVILLSLDARETGQIWEETAVADGGTVTADGGAAAANRLPVDVTVTSTHADGEWLIEAAAPIQNEDGVPLGAVHLIYDARELTDFLAALRNGLWLAGGIFILIGAALSWLIATPLVRVTRQLTAHANGVCRGQYQRLAAGKPLPFDLSLRARLSLSMIAILALMVCLLQLVAIPIERQHVEHTLQDGLLTGVTWAGSAISDLGLTIDDWMTTDITDLLTLSPPASNLQSPVSSLQSLAKLQEVMEAADSQDVAYSALMNASGEIVFADQLSLLGQTAVLPTTTILYESVWHGEVIWVISTPLTDGRGGAQIGAWEIGVRRTSIETFLDESRNLFRLTGLIAILAGVILAQGLGTAVAAPMQRLAADTRRVAQGDFSVQFKVNSRDELAALAAAYNEMVQGLQEREWLRDMFGRFVSQEVAEAIRGGQVKLAGENRVVSVLFCDIRSFTARSERSTPQEIVALLNEYLPIVVNAAQRHDGTVNKFGGDSTLVIYGAPKAVPESAYHAVRTALDMRQNLAALNEKLIERGIEPLRIGVGINTGIVLAGAVGPPERQEYTVIGDTVNLASRIEALNKTYPDYDILISDHTYAALGLHRQEFTCVDLGTLSIRGKEEVVRVWAVTS